ncbi:Lrp/AsnC family transcriptional regulator [Limnoraphis robusta]|uniref:Lrp/AsnC family transcriptional regulator n=1 Tax=Limnoraphis robusta CCNP1315 TaxID=3110306 RepID=A0ABU5U5Y8_9CYAN|nr:Lrp/AsnC family transcriptional regulator [Limnoraphis robusta]MEA5498879.1 Lrp/AsnC family transcriptional regulator [Limnoraphis robusta BA-68 BA1]MEA5522594.1 Lrp/AsnC family transcriptional regulator [Limnoraphis robusta CCNP1315]MEA5546505.1 Lrp/AsnC family transcriptional regulator [Limnoraphis robusta CCNP1324]
MDAIDNKVIQHLMVQGRITWSELATLLGLSAPATAERVRRLEERGIIQGYNARINPEAVGCELMAFIAVTLQQPQYRDAFLQRIQEISEVMECHHVTGDDDYLLKVRCQNTRHLERIVSEQIKGISGILRTRTTVVLSTSKETSAIPLPPFEREVE